MDHKFLCVCPTWGRPPHILQNTLACFEAQTWPDRFLIILDDLGNIDTQSGENWAILSTPLRFPNLPEKYHAMLLAAHRLYPDWNAAAIWDDDDLYLSRHLEANAMCLDRYSWAHPLHVWSTYPGDPIIEGAAGRFYASATVQRSFLESWGGWRLTDRADFDQLFLRDAGQRQPGNSAQPFGPQFVFRWADTGCPHAQHAIRTPDDTQWYGRLTPSHELPIRRLEPAFDQAAIKTMGRIDELRKRSTLPTSINPADR